MRRRAWLRPRSTASPSASATSQPSRDLTLDVADGEFIVLLGPTGAGKTTTLRLFAGLETPDAGPHRHRRPRRHRAPPRRGATSRSCSSNIRSTRTYPCSTISPFRCGRRCAASRRRRSSQRVTGDGGDAAHRHKLDNRATQLSGGEMQRVSIGRALVREPAIFLMDEPLSSLDAKLREDLRVELKRIQRELGATILYVTHDQIEAMTLADRIGVLDQGRLVQFGTPREIYERPGQYLRRHAASAARRSTSLPLAAFAGLRGAAGSDPSRRAARECRASANGRTAAAWRGCAGSSISATRSGCTCG